MKRFIIFVKLIYFKYIGMIHLFEGFYIIDEILFALLVGCVNFSNSLDSPFLPKLSMGPDDNFMETGSKYSTKSIDVGHGFGVFLNKISARHFNTCRTLSRAKLIWL